MDFERVWGGFWGAFGRGLGGIWKLLGNFWRHFWWGNYALKVEIQFHRKKEVPREDLEGFGEVWEGFWRAFGGGWEPLWKAFGVDLVHFKLEISSIDTDVLWNWFSTLSVSCYVFFRHMQRKHKQNKIKRRQNISFVSKRYPFFPPGRLRQRVNRMSSFSMR